MSKVNGKDKGSTFERKIANLFSNRFKDFLKIEKGFRRNQLDQVHSPVGLDIGAQSPEEIAVAIAAEMIKVKSKKLKV